MTILSRLRPRRSRGQELPVSLLEHLLASSNDPISRWLVGTLTVVDDGVQRHAASCDHRPSRRCHTTTVRTSNVLRLRAIDPSSCSCISDDLQRTLGIASGPALTALVDRAMGHLMGAAPDVGRVSMLEVRDLRAALEDVDTRAALEVAQRVDTTAGQYCLEFLEEVDRSVSALEAERFLALLMEQCRKGEVIRGYSWVSMGSPRTTLVAARPSPPSSGRVRIDQVADELFTTFFGRPDGSWLAPAGLVGATVCGWLPHVDIGEPPVPEVVLDTAVVLMRDGTPPGAALTIARDLES